MGQFKSIDSVLQAISNDENVHHSLRSAISHAMRREVYILVCNETILDVYANKDTAEYEMRLCIQGDLLDGETTTNYRVLTKALNQTRLCCGFGRTSVAITYGNALRLRMYRHRS